MIGACLLRSSDMSGIVCRQEIIMVCWRIEEKGGGFKVEFECIKVDGADTAE